MSLRGAKRRGNLRGSDYISILTTFRPPRRITEESQTPPCHCEERSDVAISAAATIFQSLRRSDHHDGLRKNPNPHLVIARSAATWQSPRQRLYFNPYVFPTTLTGRAIKVAFYAKKKVSVKVDMTLSQPLFVSDDKRRLIMRFIRRFFYRFARLLN